MLRDRFSNSCCNLYFHLSFAVCMNAKFLMREKSRCNHINCNDCMAHFNFNAVVVMLCVSYNTVIYLHHMQVVCMNFYFYSSNFRKVILKSFRGPFF